MPKNIIYTKFGKFVYMGCMDCTPLPTPRKKKRGGAEHQSPGDFPTATATGAGGDRLPVLRGVSGSWGEREKGSRELEGVRERHGV